MAGIEVYCPDILCLRTAPRLIKAIEKELSTLILILAMKSWHMSHCFDCEVADGLRCRCVRYRRH